MSATPAMLKEINRRFVVRILREHLAARTIPPGWDRAHFIAQLQVNMIPVPASLLTSGGAA